MSQPNQTPPSNQPPAEHGTPSPQHIPESHISARTAIAVLLVLLIAGVVIAVVGIVQRKHARSALAAETNALAAPDVTVSKAKSGSPNAEIVLPGNIIAFEDAPIYARTNGYLSRWYFDIGARVHKGQLLAIISTPEVDQQLLQARADLATAESNAGFAKNTAQRYQNLLQSDAVSRQDTDNFTTQAQSSNTTVKSQQANVQRLEQLQSFERVYAPFNGVVTSRSIDIGQLIDQGAAKELFHLSSTDTLRVYVNVPQVYSRDALPGAKAQLTFAEYPGRSFEGNLVRTAKAIDLVSRTLLVEVDVDNRSGQLAPGAYTEVHLKVGRPVTTVVIPVSALLFRKEGLRVVSVQHTADGDTAKLIPIAVGHDDGDTVQVVSGLDPDTPIVTDPPDSVIDGEKLHVLQPDQAQKAEQGQ
ncbi:MAG: rane fusion protein multidrug efflux system [Acidobacteriaceae bacterium]|jgi:RND family efflux transporter MFP subunit|nr:rane fusion protein multidrug efflux system [Acidobacteriaceae bacterium]